MLDFCASESDKNRDWSDDKILLDHSTHLPVVTKYKMKQRNLNNLKEYTLNIAIGFINIKASRYSKLKYHKVCKH